MRTPDEYKKSLDDGTITEQMLSDCLFSVNKRAKNHRDKVREYNRAKRAGEWRWRYRLLDSLDESERRRDEYYRLKSILLSLVEPTCLHMGRDRPYYYKYYEVGRRSFHEPITKEEANELKDSGMELVNIGVLQTKGAGTGDLLSVQFVRKVVALVESGRCSYVKE